MADAALSGGVPAGDVSTAPVMSDRRIGALDTIRGLALLGILVMNIPWFAYHSFSGVLNPLLQGGYEGLDRLAFDAAYVLFNQKMMTLFSLLFGAGVCLFADKARARNGSAAGLHYRRMGWLLVIGLAHAYLIWEGDILVTYALCGMLVFPAYRLRPAWLVAIAVVLLVISAVLSWLFGWWLGGVRDAWIALEAGEDAPGFFAEQASQWPEMREGFSPTEERRAAEEAAFTGGYLDLLPQRVELALGVQLGYLPFGLGWRVAGIMLLGMALYRSGFLTGRLRAATSAAIAAVALPVGFAMDAVGVAWLRHIEFEFIEMMSGPLLVNMLASTIAAIGWAALLLAICRAGVLRPMTDALAAVGRMAFTNYLAHSILCSLLFYGYGFGLWGKLSRAELLLVVVGIWTVQLIWSPLWLAHFRFGPMEWLWRSLTYLRVQPMTRPATAAQAEERG